MDDLDMTDGERLRMIEKAIYLDIPPLEILMAILMIVKPGKVPELQKRINLLRNGAIPPAML